MYILSKKLVLHVDICIKFTVGIPQKRVLNEIRGFLKRAYTWTMAQRAAKKPTKPKQHKTPKKPKKPKKPKNAKAKKVELNPKELKYIFKKTFETLWLK